MNAMHNFQVQCRDCGQRWHTGATLKREKQKAWQELHHQPGADLNDDAVLRHLLARVLPSHVCRRSVSDCIPPEEPRAGMGEPQSSPGETNILNLIVQVIADAEQRGERFTVRGFCRYHRGMGGLGRESLRKAVEREIAAGQLTLLDDRNGSGTGVKLLALPSDED